ncbi:hypothetical protein GS399_14655 [Pedobacter sp. HMF7647]|uniref:Outer membrane beta-barrel protein n=1 Tax=Hufsiella arboris TaxID=2695275 RepID=A0A7K1YCA4_9SPHI|nr:hypothetical protein [Hufsiella arboris]MXV52216.1 hypothetical protein [Hufsiella arboris]
MIKRLLFLILVKPTILFCQVNTGPRLTGLANASVAMQDVWSMQSNQAGILQSKKPIISAAYLQNYASTDVATKSAVMAVPFMDRNAAGVSFQSFGFSAYKEQKIGLCYARSFGGKLNMALNFNYHQLSISSYGNESTYSVDAGLQYFINDDLIIGSHVSNLSKSGYSKFGSFIPTVFELGVAWRTAGKVLLSAEVMKTLDSSADVRAGLEYALADWFSLRGGISANPFMQYAGFGFDYHGFRLDSAVSSHPDLGYLPQIGLTYAF